jgi:hypothetical protein
MARGTWALAVCRNRRLRDRYELDGEIVPQAGVDPARQLRVLLSRDREADSFSC